MNIHEYLTQHGVPHEVLEHPETFDAQRMAQALHVSGHRVGKTVLLRLDHGFRRAVAVLPAALRLDLDLVSRHLGGAHVEIVSEPRLVENCPDCEVGAIPPFGKLYGMMTLADETLTHCDDVTFEGNNHHESIRLKWADFAKLEHPMIGHIAVPYEAAHAERS